VEIGRGSAAYTLLSGDPLVIHHHGESLTVEVDKVSRRDIPPLKPLAPPSQPEHRRPNRATAHEG
jgi:alpha,alpha-trehalose phosphorylase